MPRLTTEALDALLAKHQPCHEDCQDQHSYCQKCQIHRWWPCDIYLLATEVRAARPVIEKATGMVHHWADCNCPTMNPQHPEEFDCMYNGQLEAALGHYEVGRTE